jgi:hypothetical protein
MGSSTLDVALRSGRKGLKGAECCERAAARLGMSRAFSYALQMAPKVLPYH